MEKDANYVASDDTSIHIGTCQEKILSLSHVISQLIMRRNWRNQHWDKTSITDAFILLNELAAAIGLVLSSYLVETITSEIENKPFFFRQAILPDEVKQTVINTYKPNSYENPLYYRLQIYQADLSWYEKRLKRQPVEYKMIQAGSLYYLEKNFTKLKKLADQIQQQKSPQKLTDGSLYLFIQAAAGNLAATFAPLLPYQTLNSYSDDTIQIIAVNITQVSIALLNICSFKNPQPNWNKLNFDRSNIYPRKSTAHPFKYDVDWQRPRLVAENGTLTM